MPDSTGDEETRRARDAVERELRRREPPRERDLVETVGEEQRRERAETDPDGDGERE